MLTETPSRYTAAIHAALIVIVTTAVYSGSFRVGWVFDDRHAIVENPAIRDLGSAFRQIGSGTRSLAQFTFALNYHFGELDPWGYHLFNLAVHIAAGMCLYGWLRAALPAGDAVIAFFAALLFAVHPLATQSVTYVVQRYSSMAGMFFFASLWAWAMFRKKNQWTWFLLALLAGLGGMLCKEMAIAIPLALIAADLALHRDGRFPPVTAKLRWLPYLPLALMTAVVPLLNAIRPPAPDQSVAESLNWAPGAGITPAIYFLSELRVLVFTYLRLALLPYGLCVDHAYSIVRSPWDGPTLLAATILLLLLIVSSWLAFGSTSFARRLAGVGGLLFFLGLGATSTFIPNSQFVQEQRAYVSLAGIVVMIAAGIFSMRLPRRGVAACLVLAAMALAVLTYQRNQTWQSEWELWQDAVTKNPESPRAHTNLGVMLLAQGKRADAIARYQRALTIAPGYYMARYNLGTALGEEGKLEEATQELQLAVAIYSGDFRAYYNLGNALRRLKRLEEAADAYRRALALVPGDYRAHYNLGLTLQQQGKRDEAMEHYRAALRAKPDHEPSKKALAQLAR